MDTTNGLIYAALHQAVGSVYAVWVTTNLAGDWQVESEVQPTDTNRQAFTLSTRGRDWLWLKAEDWSHKDSNGDGVPDAWAFEYFGGQYLSVNASNLDAQGVNTIGFDYTNGLDPNVISFTIGITNRFINADTANVRLNITAGVPSYYAMRINDAAETNWQAFAATNLSVPLGATDGVYTVSVGLKGFAPDATETWKSITFYRATSPLMLMLTNLPALSGSRPFIDPAGWASRQLQSLTWTLVNANGVTHTGLGAAVGDGLNPANPILVTNQFSCVDLALALGTNHITLQAADWAGNVAVTNFDYVFATNGDVTAPVIRLLWPTNGSAISGDTFLVRAWLDDDTATAVLQYTDTNAEVQTIPGQLERGGNLWFANVPLAAGTNGFTLTATDAAGNVSRTNFSVAPSGLALAITSFSDDSLNSGYVTVYGTVSDPNSTVSVNGVAGTNDAGNWSVADVPVPPGGAVMFLAQATGGGGATGEAAMEKEKSPVMFTQTYHYSLDYTVTNVGAMWGPVTNGAGTHHISLAWARGVGGTNENNWVFTSSTDGTVESSTTVTVWPADAGYLPTLGGQQIVKNCVNGGMFDSYTNAVAAPSVEWMEKTVSDGSAAGVYPVSWSESSDREVRLFTGGKALRQRQNLFDLTADLTQVDQVDWDVPDWDSLYATGGFLGPDNPPVKVPSARIRLDELGPLGGDGHLWQILPENREYKVTPKAEGYDFTGGPPGQQKFEFAVKANGVALDPDAVNVTNCVGQNIVFTLDWLPSRPAIVSSNHPQWTLGGTYVNTNLPPVYADASADYTNDPALLKAETTHGWWYDGAYDPAQKLGAVFEESVNFSNGQTVDIIASGIFAMHRPKYDTNSLNHIVEALTHGHGFQQPPTGDILWVYNGNFSLAIKSKYPGVASAYLTQTENISKGNDTGLYNFSTAGSYYLDNTLIYGDTFNESNRVINVVPSGTNNILPFQDGPGISCSGHTWNNSDFMTYVMFFPEGGIPVTLGIVRWHSHGESDLTLPPLLLDYTPPVSPSSAIDAAGRYYEPTGDAAFDDFSTDNLFPKWIHTYHNGDSN